MKVVRIISAITALIVMAAVTWKSIGTRAGNKLVEESNAAHQEAIKVFNEAIDFYQALLKDENVNGLPGNRAQLKPKVDQAASHFEKAGGGFLTAASKLDEAGKQPVDSKVGEYWKLRSEVDQKMAARADALRKVVLLFADEAVVDMDGFNKKLTPLMEVAKKNNEEAEAAAGKAAKLQEANKDVIKNPS